MYNLPSRSTAVNMEPATGGNPPPEHPLIPIETFKMLERLMLEDVLRREYPEFLTCGGSSPTPLFTLVDVKVVKENEGITFEPGQAELQEGAAATGSTTNDYIPLNPQTPLPGSSRGTDDVAAPSLSYQLLRAIRFSDVAKIERLLDSGANSNAEGNVIVERSFTCKTSACHLAAMANNHIVSLLLDRGADGRKSLYGRTPLHVAAQLGNLKPLLALLGIPLELQNKLNAEGLTTEIEEKIKEFANETNLNEILNEICHRNMSDFGMQLAKIFYKECINLPLVNSGCTPLHAAASGVHVDCCRLLLAAGADPYIQDRDGLTPLDVVGSCIDETQKEPFWSASFKNMFTEVIEILLKFYDSKTFAGLDKGSFRMERTTSLHIAAEIENLDAAILLLQFGYPPTITNNDGTPLHICVRQKNQQLLQAFIDNDSRDVESQSPRVVNATNKEGYTVMHYAVVNNWLEGVQACLEAGASMQPANNRETPIQNAAILKNSNILETLLSYVASTSTISVGNDDVQTALNKAIESGQTECVKLLLQEIASIEFLYEQRNVFRGVIERGQAEILQLLLNHNESFTRQEVNAKTDCGETILFIAIKHGLIECVEMLLENGASMENTSDDRYNVFHVAAKWGQVEILKWLLQRQSTLIRKNIDAKNKYGETPLFVAIKHSHTEFVKILLQNAASIDITSNDRCNVLHIAAERAQVEILKLLLIHDKTSTRRKINSKNKNGETALITAIKAGSAECVKLLLQEGASIEVTLPDQFNVFHIAAQLGWSDVLKVLLDYDETFTRNQIDSKTSYYEGFAPIHFAFDNSCTKCVDLLIAKHASINLRTSDSDESLLHIAAKRNNLKLAKLILNSDPSAIHSVVKLQQWTPLHTACFFRSKDVARLLVIEGANLIAYGRDGQTAIEMVMNNLSNPKEFLKSIFDTCIQPTKLSYDKPYVKINYRILVPSRSDGGNTDENNQKSSAQLEVIEGLLKTGNSYDQKRLLIHPLLESFICLKWKALVPFIYGMILIHFLFALTLTTFIMTDFVSKDSKNTNDSNYNKNNNDSLVSVIGDYDTKNNNDTKVGKVEKTIWKPICWTIALYITIAMVLFQEVIFLRVNFKKYFCQIDTILKLAVIILAMIVPILIVIEELSPSSSNSVDWARHVATAAILLCWLNIIFLLSKFRKWGCYVLIFPKVLFNMVKILLTFAGLIIGFALCFMIQFHHETPFESFRSAFIKTMVMMSSEFDYEDLVKEQNGNALNVIRAIFFIYLILAPIVLMNLMLGATVADLNDLEVLGRTMQLENKVELIRNTMALIDVINQKVLKCFPTNLAAPITRIKDRLDRSGYLTGLTDLSLNCRRDDPVLEVTCHSKKCMQAANSIPVHVRDAMFKIAVAQEKSVELSRDKSIANFFDHKSENEKGDFNANIDLMVQMLIQMKGHKSRNL